MKNKGFVLSLDAVIALIFIISLMAALTSLHYFKKSDTSKTEFELQHYISEDALEVMNKKTITGESSLKAWELPEDVLDISVLDRIGRYWAECMDLNTIINVSNLTIGKEIKLCNRNTNADVSKAECNADGKVCNITTCHIENCTNVLCGLNATSTDYSIDDFGTSYFNDASVLSNLTLNSTHRIYNCSSVSNYADYNQTASGVAKFYLSSILNYPSVGFRLKFCCNETSCDESTCSTIYEDQKIPEAKAKTKTSSKRLLVGYSPGAAVTGCSTRAQLTSIRNKHSASYSYFGGYEGDGDLTKYLNLPETFSYEDAYIEVSAGSGFNLYINDNLCKCIPAHVQTGTCTGDSFSPSGAGLNANLKADLICAFEPGENKIDIKFKGSKNKSIGGGYIKVGYVTSILGEEKNLTAGQVTDRFYLTGIEGIINLYTSFYMPGTITSINAYLHYNSNSTQFLRIGNAEIYNNKSNGTTEVYIPWSNINASLTAKNYTPAMLSQTTVPLRFGTSDIPIGGYGIADTILITDLTGSMNWQMGSTNVGTYRANCSDPNINLSSTSRVSVARCVDKEFIDAVLGGAKGHRVGLVSYSDGMVRDSYPLSDNASQLKSYVEANYNASASGATCICCAIREARKMLTNVPPVSYAYIEKNSVWTYNTSFPSSEPPNDTMNNSWKGINYNDSTWGKDYSILGFENTPYSPGISTDIGSNTIILYSDYNASNYSLSKGSVSGGNLSDTKILDNTSFDISGAGIPGWNVNYYAESAGESTTSSTSFQDKTVLTFTPASGDYLIIASGLIGESSTSRYAEVLLNIDGTNYSINEFMPSGSASQNYYSFGTHKVITLNAGAHNAVIRYRTSSNNSGAYAKIKNAIITAVKVSDYYKNESESLSTIGSTTYQNKTALTFTPPQKGDYLIIASADLSENSNSRYAYAQLTYNGNTIGEMIREPTSSTVDNFYTFSTIRDLTLDSALQTFKIQYKSSNTGSQAKIKNARITAIKIENFPYAESESEGKTTSTGYVDKTLLSFTPPAAGDYLIIASAFVKQESTSERVYAQMNIDDSTYIEKQYRPRYRSDYVPFFALKKINFDNNTHTIKIQYKTSSASTSSEAYIKNARIIAVPLFTTYKTDISLDSQTIYRPEALNTINASIVFKSNVSGKYQMKIYNFDTSNWDLSNCSKSTVLPGVQNNYSCIITKNAKNYVNNSIIKISLTGDTTNPALTKIDFVQYYLKDAEGYYYFRKNFTVANISEITSAKLYVLSDDSAEIYLNGHLIDNDTAKHSQSAEYWNRDYMDVNKSYFINGTNIVAAKLRNYDNDSAKFDLELTANLSTIRKKYIIVMTDGIANRQCNDSNESDTKGIDPSDDVTRCGDQFSQHAANDAINDSCKAHNQTGSIVYSIGFGPVSSCPEGASTLQGIANCGKGLYYASSSASNLSIIYSEIAQQILNSSYRHQTMEVEGGIIKDTLYPDSYVEFNYVPLPFPLRYKEISISEETLDFGELSQNDSVGMPYKTGCFYIAGGNKSNVRVIDSRITSYSSDYWTDEVQINTTGNWISIYDLSSWGNNYSVLGDPYTIGINPTLIKPGEKNCIRIKTGTAPGINNSGGGSPDNKVIYTIALSGSVDYSPPFTKCKGSTLTVWYNYEGNENNRNRTIGYGPDPTDPFDPEIDSIDYQMLQLLNKLNFRNNITSGSPVKLNNRTTDPFISYGCNNTKTIDNGTCMLSDFNTYPSNISDDIGDGSCCNPIDIDINEEDVEFIYISAGSVRSLWGPAVVRLEVWM